MQAERGGLQCSPMYHAGMLGLISVKPQSSTTCTADEGFRANYMMPLSSVCMTPIQQEQTSSKACIIIITTLCGSVTELYTIKQHSDARPLHCAMPQEILGFRIRQEGLGLPE